MSLINGLNDFGSIQYTFEQKNSGTRKDMTEQFGQSGVKAFLFQKKFKSSDETIKDTKEYQQLLLADRVGFSNYREMGEALKSGKISSKEVRAAFRELEEEGIINPEYFQAEAKDSLQDKVGKLKEQAFNNSSYIRRSEIADTLTGTVSFLGTDNQSFLEKHGLVPQEYNFEDIPKSDRL